MEMGDSYTLITKISTENQIDVKFNAKYVLAYPSKKPLDIPPVLGILEPIQFIGGGWPVKG
jgi:hypothetical protein